MDHSILPTLIFFVGSFFFIAFGLAACLLYQKSLTYLFGLMVFSLCFPDWSITFFPIDYYHIATRGVEIHLSDLIAFILFVSMILKPKSYPITWFPPLTLAFAFYFLSGIISWSFAESTLGNPNYTELLKTQDPKFLFPLFKTGLYPIFELIKIVRSYFIFWVACNYLRKWEDVEKIAKLIPFMLFVLCSRALIQRYGFGVYRTDGGMGHANVFNVFSGMLGVFCLPFAFSEKNMIRSSGYYFSILLATVCIILTVSRSALLGFGIAGLVGGFWGLKNYFNAKNICFSLMAAFGMLALFLKSAGTLFARFFVAEPLRVSESGRAALNYEAVLIFKDHPMGVGMGNFSAYSLSHYYKLANAEIAAMAHNIWFLTLAENGWIGVIALVLFWLLFLKVWFKTYKRAPSLQVKTALMAILCLQIVFLVQSWFHFTFRVTNILFLSIIMVGFTVGLYLKESLANRAFLPFVNRKNPGGGKEKSGSCANT